MPEQLAPSLCGDRVAAAFPFYLHVDPQGRLISCGASLKHLVKDLQPGAAIHEHIEIRRPRGLGAQQTDWRRYEGSLCVLRTQHKPPVMLRGSVLSQPDGSALLLCAAIITEQSQLRTHGLGFEHFAPHDALGDMLMIHQTMKMSLDDAVQQAARLRQRSAELETVLALSPQGIAYFDANAVLKIANQALADLLVIPRSELLGLDLEQIAELCQARLSGQESRRIEAEVLRAQPSPLQGQVLRFAGQRMVRLDLQPAPDAGLVLHLQDVTQEFEVDRMKSEFLSTAAHELRTPMTSVHGFVELLLCGRYKAERQQEMFEAIHRQTGRLIEMVNQLLDLARIEARQGEDLEIRSLDPERLLQDAALAFCAPDARVPTLLPLPAQDMLDGPARLLGDERQILQALSNLLSNAFKYSPQGGEVVLDARRGLLKDGREAWGLRVSDQGIGMTESQLSRVFERFFRADPSGTILGTGLGMCLVKELIELQGGEVEVQSQIGRGTQVTLWLPLRLAPRSGDSRSLGLRADATNRP